MRAQEIGWSARLAVIAGSVLLVACSAGGTRIASPSGTMAEASADGASAAATVGSVEVGTVTLMWDGCGLDAPDTTVTGTSVLVTAVNQTEYQGAFDMWRINDDRTYQDLVDHVAAEVEAASAGRPVLGHPGFVTNNLSSGIVAAGATGRIEGRVTPGTYAIVCLGHYDTVADDPFRPQAVVGPIEVR